MNSFKKIFFIRKQVFLFVFSMLLVATTALPHKAYALLGLGDVVHDPLHAIISSGNLAATGGLNLKEYSLDPLAYAVKTIALQSITKSVVNWINSGFDGSPAFVQDLQSEFSRIGDTVATRFIDEFTAQSGLQDLPWRDEIAQSVLGGYFQSTGKDGFYLQNPYTLDQVSSDPRAFVNGDYSKGGLAAWRELVFNPGANNPLLFRDALKESLNSRVSGAQEVRRTELNWNNGFNSFRGKCAKASPTFTGGTNANTGSVLSFDGSSASTGSGTRPASVSLTNTDNCLGSPILTPGSVIAQSANKYLVDNGLEQYISADEIGEIVNALMGQLVGSVLGGGGLAGTSRPTSGGGASYADRLGSASQSSAASVSSSFSTTISNQVSTLIEYKANWQKISDAAAAANVARPAACNNLATSVLTQAGLAISSATSGISALQKIQSDLTTAISTTNSAQAEAITTVSTDYQILQSSGALPSISDIEYAKEQSTDGGSGAASSLYTQMIQLQSTGTCPQ